MQVVKTKFGHFDTNFLETLVKNYLCIIRDLWKIRYENTERNVKKTYSACKTVVSSKSTFLFSMLNLGVSLGRFREVSFSVGVGPILISGVLLPTEINMKFHKNFNMNISSNLDRSLIT